MYLFTSGRKISNGMIKWQFDDSCTDILIDHVLIALAGSDLLDDEEDTPTS